MAAVEMIGPVRRPPAYFKPFRAQREQSGIDPAKIIRRACRSVGRFQEGMPIRHHAAAVVVFPFAVIKHGPAPVCPQYLRNIQERGGAGGDGLPVSLFRACGGMIGAGQRAGKQNMPGA